MRFVRMALIALILVSGPASLFVMGWGLMLIYKAAGLVAFLLSCLSLVIVGLGFASLLDEAQSHQNR